MRRKGELSPAAIDRGWPHQVVLPARLSERGGYNEIHEFCKDLTLCSRGHAVYEDSGFMYTASRIRPTLRRSGSVSAARRLTRRNEEEGGTGPVGAGAKLPT